MFTHILFFGLHPPNEFEYWGWVKYQYHEVPNKTLQEAHTLAVEKLDVCPRDVIRQFINHSWRFLSAYCKGLVGKAAAWAVKRHKQHRAISQSTMTSIEAVLNAP